MKLHDNPQYIALQEALKERGSHYKDFKEDLLYGLKDKDNIDFVKIEPQDVQWAFNDEWSQSLAAFNFDKPLSDRIDKLKDLNLIKAHRHVYGNNGWEFPMNTLEILCEDSISDDPLAEKYRAKFNFDDKAATFVDQMICRHQHEDEPAYSPNSMSCYDSAYIAAFFFDVASKMLKSDKTGKQKEYAVYADKLQQIAESEIKIANALYDFSESLADKIGITAENKVQKKVQPIIL